MASINDLFALASSGSAPVTTQLATQKVVGAPSLSLSLATGWPTTTPVHFMLYTLAADGKTVQNLTLWKGLLSGTTISTLTLRSGTDIVYAAGSYVVAAPTSSWADDLITGILVDHNEDGTHKVLTESNIIPTNAIQNGAVTAAKIAAGAVGSAAIATAGVIPSNLVSGAGSSWGWQSFTPTIANLTVGGGTLTAQWNQIGKIVNILVTLGTGAGVGVLGDMSFAPPVTPATYPGGNNIIGIGTLSNGASQSVIGAAFIQGGSSAIHLGYFAPSSTTNGLANSGSFTFSNSTGYFAYQMWYFAA